MPGGDGTGPLGLGPMTGRAAGYCAGYSAPGYANPIPGRGWGLGYGRGWGRGFGRGFGFAGLPARQGWAGYPYAYGNPYTAPTYPANITAKQEADMLSEEARVMQEEIDAINNRIKDLESAQTSESNE
ncbi:MAG: hypothetical protein A3K83_07930 [Omnitrophica WOR_2 bacterium RBG_13_44_8b]|nr:MAG: hypothetical protein A3K83_07930 [Omnitrophica WOR_2 bacterium RBG_13_44_8b]